MTFHRGPDGGGDAQLGGGISRGLVVLLAVACGAAPPTCTTPSPCCTPSPALRVSDGTAGLIITITQLGYVLGLALLVPLGDLRERRRLITGTCWSPPPALAVAAAAPAFAVSARRWRSSGSRRWSPRSIVPMSSSLAAEHERGRSSAP